MKPLGIIGLVAVVALAAGGLGGCGSTAINPGARTTFLTADDLTTMTDRMAAAIASDPEVLAAAGQGPLVIVLQPIINDTNEIIVGNEKQLYTHRVRALLSNKPALRDRFTFVLNQRDYQTLQQQEGLSAEALGPPEGRLVPGYALKGRFLAQTNASSLQRSDYYLCTYQLTKISGPESGLILWEGTYETKKTVKKGMLD